MQIFLKMLDDLRNANGCGVVVASELPKLVARVRTPAAVFMNELVQQIRTTFIRSQYATRVITTHINDVEILRRYR